MKAIVLAAALLCTLPLRAQDSRAPEMATGWQDKAGWSAQKFMVAAANPLATQAGYQMLKQGGSAVDAAIATQLVLTLVEPQSSGIGGGAFMMHWDGKKVRSFDGRETAPAVATETLFQDANGKPLPRAEGVVGGRSVGAPGVLRMLELAHREYGKLAWPQLFAPAIKLAEEGFAVSPRLHALLSSERYLQRDPVAAAYFFDQDRQAWPAGHILKNPALARTLREIAAEGADAFYRGHIARDIAAKVQGHPSNPGGLTAADIGGYKAREREPVCSDYRAYTVCGMPPPSSGGIAIAQILGILETSRIGDYAPVNGVLSADAIHLMSEAERLAYADRNRYVADTDFVPLPGKGASGLLDKSYLRQRATLIGDKSMGRARPGVPSEVKVAWGDDSALDKPSTSHLVVVDANGNAISMTTSVEDAFGSRQMVDGFLLNNQLTDFSWDAVDENGPIANRVQPGKRPRSAMSPTLVFDKQSRQLVLATGSPGGSTIINYVSKVLVGALDWKLNVQQAISLPNFGSRNGPTELEAGKFSSEVIGQLKARGHEVRQVELNSGLQGLQRTPSGWFGGADPRREGIVRGE